MGPPKKSLSPALSRVGFKSKAEVNKEFGVKKGNKGTQGADGSEDDEFKDDDLDISNADDTPLSSTKRPSFHGSTLPPRQSTEDDFDDEDNDDPESNIVFGNVGHRKKRQVMGGKVVRTPSFKIDSPRVRKVNSAAAPSNSRVPDRQVRGGTKDYNTRAPGSLHGVQHGGQHGVQHRGQHGVQHGVQQPPGNNARIPSGPPIHNYRSQWESENGNPSAKQQQRRLSISNIDSGPQLASVVVNRSREIRRALDKLRVSERGDLKNRDSDDDDEDSNSSYSSYESYYSEESDDDPDGDDDDGDKRGRRKVRKKIRPKNSKKDAKYEKDYVRDLGRKERERLREAMVMLIRSAERAGIDMNDPHDQSEERESIFSDLISEASLLPEATNENVKEYENKLRSVILREWTKQFRFSSQVNSIDDAKSPYEIFEEMKKNGTLNRLLENDEEDKEETKSITNRESKKLEVADALLDRPLPKEITIEMPATIPWEAELECRPGDGKIIFVGVVKDGPAAAAGIVDGDLLAQVGFDVVKARDLESACRIIWDQKKQAAALKQMTCTVTIIPLHEDASLRSVAPQRKRGDKRRHGLGDQGQGNTIMKVTAEHKEIQRDAERLDLKIGLNRVLLPARWGTNERWGINLDRAINIAATNRRNEYSGDPNAVGIAALSKSGAGRAAGLQKNDIVIAFILPKEISKINTDSSGRPVSAQSRASKRGSSKTHILLNKIGSMKRVRKEIEFARQAANEAAKGIRSDGGKLELIVYRPPTVHYTSWLSLRMGFEMTSKDGNTIVGRISSNGSAFRNGVRTGDIIVRLDGIQISGPSISLNTALNIVDDCRHFAKKGNRKVMKIELCRHENIINDYLQ